MVLLLLCWAWILCQTLSHGGLPPPGAGVCPAIFGAQTTLARGGPDPRYSDIPKRCTLTCGSPPCTPLDQTGEGRGS